MTTTRTDTHHPVDVDRTSPVNRGALLVGATFLVVGIAGFIPDLTTDPIRSSSPVTSPGPSNPPRRTPTTRPALVG